MTPQRKRSRLPWIAAVLLVLSGAVVLGLITSGELDRASGGESTAASSGRGRGLPGPRPQTMTPAADDEFARYGRARASEHVGVRFKKAPRAGLLFNVKTGEVLWSLHPRRKRSIASLTKMMTAILTVRELDPDAQVHITKEVLNYRGSGVGVFKRGKRFQLETVLYGLLLPSGNDAAIALAQRVSGTVARFVNLMNAEARRLGLRCTRFTGPDGYDKGNRSCPRDLAVLARVVLRQPRLARIVRTRSAVRKGPVKGRRVYLYNHNPLQRLRFKGVTGVKTGFTDEAGRCFVGTARRGGVHLGVVLLNSPDTGGQARTLLTKGFRAMGVSKSS